jgi:hypothetical protein
MYIPPAHPHVVHRRAPTTCKLTLVPCSPTGDGEPPDRYVFVLPSLRVYIWILPGTIIRYNASKLWHCTWWDFHDMPPSPAELEGTQDVYDDGTMLLAMRVHEAHWLTHPPLTRVDYHLYMSLSLQQHTTCACIVAWQRVVSHT